MRRLYDSTRKGLSKTCSELSEFQATCNRGCQRAQSTFSHAQQLTGFVERQSQGHRHIGLTRPRLGHGTGHYKVGLTR